MDTPATATQEKTNPTPKKGLKNVRGMVLMMKMPKASLKRGQQVQKEQLNRRAGKNMFRCLRKTLRVTWLKQKDEQKALPQKRG